MNVAHERAKRTLLATGKQGRPTVADRDDASAAPSDAGFIKARRAQSRRRETQRLSGESALREMEPPSASSASEERRANPTPERRRQPRCPQLPAQIKSQGPKLVISAIRHRSAERAQCLSSQTHSILLYLTRSDPCAVSQF